MNNIYSNHNHLKKNVLIVYHYFAHYRLPIIQELSHDKDISYFFISGKTTNKDITIIDSSTFIDNKINWKTVKNIWIFNKRLLWQTGIIRECLSGNYDCVIFLGTPQYISTWLAAIILRLIGKHTLFWTHGIIRDKFRDKVKIIFLKLANGLLIYGNWAKNRLIQFGFKPEHLYVIYNSLDYKNQVKIRGTLSPDMLLSKRRSYFSNPDFPILLFIGRLTLQKKLDQLIIACEKLHQMGLSTNLLFIGDGEDKQKLIELCQSKNLQDYITFYGESYDEHENAPLIAMADICVSPGDIGLTAIHALTYGTPVITHNNPFQQMPEFEAITHGKTGMFFEYGSINSLIDVIFSWLKNNKYNREDIRKDCYETIDNYYNPAYQAKVIKEAVMNYIKD